MRMLINIARFEFRYLLRNPLLWATAAASFALFFVADPDPKKATTK